LSEYHDAMITLLETLWGTGYMAPGGAGNVAKQIDGLDISGKRVLDISCGLGGPDHLLAGHYGATVVGIDLEEHLIERAKASADHFVESWRVMMIICEKGEMKQVYIRAKKP